MFYGREQFNWIKAFFCQILWNVSGELPYTFQNQFGNLGFLGIGRRPVRGKGFYDLQEKGEERSRK
jgi:hypothetical protein